MDDLLEYILKNAEEMPEHDCMGKPLKSFDDLGGQCKLGEYAHKDNYFTCMECGENFCRKHVKFVDHDEKKPLCNYGFLGLKGCYARHNKKDYKTETEKLKIATENLKALIELEKTKRKLR